MDELELTFLIYRAASALASLHTRAAKLAQGPLSTVLQAEDINIIRICCLEAGLLKMDDFCHRVVDEAQHMTLTIVDGVEIMAGRSELGSLLRKALNETSN